MVRARDLTTADLYYSEPHAGEEALQLYLVLQLLLQPMLAVWALELTCDCSNCSLTNPTIFSHVHSHDPKPKLL